MLEMRTQEARKAAGEGGLTPALGRHTPSYPKTVESCIRSAETVLDALEEAKALGHPGVQVRYSDDMLCIPLTRVIDSGGKRPFTTIRRLSFY